MLELKADKKRFEKFKDQPTGIFVRGKDPDGKIDNLDIAQLDKESLLSWLASRDDHQCKSTNWRDQTILILLGHPR